MAAARHGNRAGIALEQLVDVIVIDLLGCALPRARSEPAFGRKAAARAPRATYSAFDLLAGAGTCFLLNLSITAVVPTVLGSAEARGHEDPLGGSGAVVGATSIGMVVSVVAMYGWSEALVDSKAPYYLFTTLLLLGNSLFLLAEMCNWPLQVLTAARVLMSLGFGAAFAAKRRAGKEADPKRREYHFLRLELANSLGMAAGPILSGSLAVLLPAYAPFAPPILLVLMSLGFAVALSVMPLDAPLGAVLGQEHGGGNGDGGDGSVAASPAVAMAPAHEATPLVKEAAAGGGGTASDRRVGLGEAVVVQLAMLLFGMSRNFLKFGFESAMVVVYDRQFYFSPGAAGVIAGCCALSTVFSLFLYKGFCVRHVETHALLLIAEAVGLASAALMVATGSVLEPASGVTLASAASLTRKDHQDGGGVALAELLTLSASMLFYPAMYFGAAIGNSHPLRFAIPEHPLLSRPAMLAQQEILQKTVGKGLGMVYCRVALGDPPSLASLGRLFFGIMAAQAVLLSLAFEPVHTRVAAARAIDGLRQCLRRRPSPPPLQP